MSVRVLGPLEVGDGTPLRGARERRLLGLLALTAPEAASRAAAMDWIAAGGDAAASALSVVVSRLRRQLRERQLDAAIESSRSGLRLVTDPDLIDAHRFRNLAALARSIDEPAERAARLADALALWRGDVLDGEDVPSGPSTTVLGELRWACVEEFHAATLDARTADAVVVGDLLAAWRAHPERERLCALAMVALYRDGRQLDALALFREAHDALVERGLEPGSDLVELEAAILRHEPSLRTAPLASSRGAVQNDPVGPASPTPRHAAKALPGELSSFVGRDRELAEVLRLIEEHRLVTITGPGGVGKTRLATRVAAAKGTSGRLPVWIVELASITDPELVATAVTEAMDLPAQGARDPRDALIDQLRSREALLILDNCEHLIESTASLARALLRAAPSLRVIATSREPLHVEGESACSLPPLAVVDSDGGAGPAVRLFMERAATGGHPLTDNPATRQAVGALCARLDGLPLAIELAAARLRSLSLHDLGARLDDRFRVLTGGPRAVPARQRTLEATVAWSYDLLDPAARALFERVSVFAGGFELDAASALVGRDEFETLDGIDQLVDRSLILATPHPERPMRFSMLETMRQFGRDRLIEHDSLDSVRDDHLRWLLGFVRQTSSELQLSAPQALSRVDRELANLRFGLDWACRDGQRAALGLDVVLALGRYWYQRGITAEAARWLHALLAREPELDQATMAAILCDLGFYLLQAGRAEDALAPLEQCLDLARSVGDDALLTKALHYTTRAGLDLLPPGQVLTRIEEGLVIARQLDDQLHTYLHEVLRTIWHMFYGERDAALRIGWEFVERHRTSSSPHIAAHVLETGAWLALLAADAETAASHLDAALATYAALANPGCSCHALEAFSWWLAVKGDASRAADVLRAVLAIRARDHHHRAAYESVPYRGVTALLGTTTGSASTFDELATGITMALDELRCSPRRAH